MRVLFFIVGVLVDLLRVRAVLLLVLVVKPLRRLEGQLPTARRRSIDQDTSLCWNLGEASTASALVLRHRPVKVAIVPATLISFPGLYLRLHVLLT